MKRAALILAALAAILTAAAAPVRTATEGFVANKIAEAVAAIPAPDFSTTNTELVATIEAKAPAPGNYAVVSNAAMNAVQTETDPVWNAEKNGYATRDDLESGMITVNDAEYAEYARDAYRAEYAVLAEGLRDGPTEIYADAIFARLDAATETNAQQTVAISSLSDNVYTKAETEAKIVELAPAPGDYATVSNRAMNAVQTETDPTVPTWAKAPAKPTYTASEVGATTPEDVTAAIREQSLGGIWDETLQVWWTPVMRNGSLTYQATTNVNLNAEN